MRLCKPCHVDYDRTPETLDRISATLTAKGGKVLTFEQMAEIQERYVPSPGRGFRGGNVKQLAEEYGVSTKTIHTVGKGITGKRERRY